MAKHKKEKQPIVLTDRGEAVVFSLLILGGWLGFLLFAKYLAG